MRRMLALALVLGVAYQVRAAGSMQPFEPRTMALALGFALIAATLTGGLLERARLPRLTGYLLFGLLCGPYVANIISRSMARELQVVNGLAIALIAFIAGMELNWTRLRPRLASIVRFGTVTLVVVYAGLFVVLVALWGWMPILPDAGLFERLALAALLTTLVVSFSPTVTIAVIAETRARGPLSELVMALVVLADLALILAFALAMQFVRAVQGADAGQNVSLAMRLMWEVGGSLAFGALLGALLGLYLRAVGKELTVMVLALCWILSQLGDRLALEPLLAALAAGLVVENIAQGDPLREAIERTAPPVLVIFFAAAGASLNLDALVTLGALALVVSGARILFIRAGTWLGSKMVAGDGEYGEGAWMGLVSQAGVTLGLVVIVAAEFPDWGVRVQTLVIALVALHQLVGPVLFRAALARAGEIGAEATAAAPS